MIKMLLYFVKYLEIVFIIYLPLNADFENFQSAFEKYVIQ